jgi:hypothetical protein
MTLESPQDESSDRGDFAPSQAFLATHRGQAAFAREYARLVSAIVADVGAAARENVLLTPIIRQSPERCIVQLGPVAMTMAWLRKGAETTANGELLLILWRGTIAKTAGEPSEYSGRRRDVVAPTILWEETLQASAESEATWVWTTEAADDSGVNSLDLAQRSVRRLTSLHDDETAVPVESISND